MSAPERELAHVEHASAYQAGSSLLLCITGDKPTPCHVVYLDQSLLDVEPPTFTAGWYLPVGVACPRVIDPYEHRQVFFVGDTERGEVHLHTVDGRRTLEVRQLAAGDEDPLTPAPTTPSVVPAAADVIPPPMPGTVFEGVGYSGDFDFTEALREAIGQIPTPDFPDWLATYTVKSIGAEIGGIAGFNHLKVTVQGR